MPDADKPRHRSAYSSEETEQVRAACLTVAITFGAYLDDICIVGGLVPTLLIDTARTDDPDEDRHPGTNDLDIALALALIDDERYAEISDRLRREGFAPDTNLSAIPRCNAGASASWGDDRLPHAARARSGSPAARAEPAARIRP